MRPEIKWSVSCSNLMAVSSDAAFIFTVELTSLKTFDSVGGMKNKNYKIKKMILDNEAWGEFYKKFCSKLVNSLNSHYCLADREDAVEFAFDKLMHRKDAATYGKKYPQCEADWLSNLHWQARSFLSHIRSRSELHAKYVEFASQALENMFVSGLQGLAMDAETRQDALARALEIFKTEQDVSFRDFRVFVLREHSQIPAKEVAARLGISIENVNVIKHRIGKLLKKYGPDCYARALRRAA